jgi:hypothetical protein
MSKPKWHLVECLEVALLPWLNGYAHELFLHSYFIVDIALYNFSARVQKGFGKKHELNFDLTLPYDV